MPTRRHALHRLLASLVAPAAAGCAGIPPVRHAGTGPPTNPAAHAMTTTPDDDPYLWLEEIDSERSLAWVRQHDAAARRVLEAVPGHAARRERVLAVLDSRDHIAQVTRRAGWLWNLWRDDEHPRGLWRRTTLDEYRKPAPQWQLLLDLDALAAAEGENWVWGGARVLGPDCRRALLQLSRGGADAVVVREFDLATLRFIDGGFTLPEAKSDVEWVDTDTIYVATDTGPGSMTDSGYPRTLRRWRRGEPLAAAPLVFEGEQADVSAAVQVDRTPGHERTVFSRALDFYRSRSWLLGADGGLRPIERPEDASLAFWRERALLELRTPFAHGGREFPAGSLLVTDAEALMEGTPRWQALFTPTPTRSLAAWSVTRSHVLLECLDDVVSTLEELRPDGAGGWVRRAVAAPRPGTLSVAAWHDPLLADDPLAEHYALGYEDFLTPGRLMLGRTGSDDFELLKTEPAFFDASGLQVEQHFAHSKDGTRVPYFAVLPQEPAPPGGRPALLRGYGGFEVSYLPWYSGSLGTAWLAEGGVLLLANIRGGGEYGPAWHQAGSREHKQNGFDDFAAVAEDAIARGITSAPRLGIEGGSNGGLLVGAVMLQRPELFGAVVCQVPLLDMRRYHHLLAGASWMAEYGNPDRPDEWAWIAPYSPYQNVRADTRLPPVLFTTSTRDDRVHPGHARKMAARMEAQGHTVLYYENIEGGHGGAADNGQRADLLALQMSHCWRELG